MKDLQKQVDSCEANSGLAAMTFGRSSLLRWLPHRQAIKDLKTELETYCSSSPDCGFCLADLNTKQFKGVDLTAIFADLDQKKAIIEGQRDQLQEELADWRWECSRLQEELWQPLTRQANLVTVAYAMLKQKKAEPSNVHLPFDSLEEIEFREKETQNEIAKFETRCSELEKPLRRILHRMDCSAVCLSGGGIRSASFSLGVLQGLSRFSMGKSWKEPPTDALQPT